MNVSETLKVTADIRVNTVTMKGSGFIVSAGFDSAKLSSYSTQVSKSQKNPALAKALMYFSEEVVDSDRPLYGVYKALEELSHTLGGRDKLAALVNRPEKYVGDVMETTQHTRHARTQSRQLLSDAECRERARVLIEAYEKSI